MIAGRTVGWWLTETITLFVLIAFVVAVVHLAGQAGAFAENRP